MAQPAPPKNNYMVALACRLGRKKLYGGIGQPAQHQNSLTKWWDTAFPLVGNLPKNYMAATLEKLYGGIWPGCPEK